MWLFIIAAKNEKIDELVRIAAITLCITIPGVFILYFFGIIGGQTIYRGCLARRSWGFENVDQLGAYVLQLMLCCYYINRQKIRSKDMVWLAAAVQKENYREFSKNMYQWIKDDDSCRQLETAIIIYVYLHRDKEEK